MTQFTKEDVRLIAFNLPQYHPIPENDLWWGRGFTEWTNVAKATPRFPGHYQPHLPADLGFYDLRLPEARQAQADLAREYGVFGFCYYHYWFNGKRLLERPFDDILASGQPDFPFCLCWANETWSRQWNGTEQDVLLKQEYTDGDDIRHIRWLINAFRDERYIRIAGKPIFLIYRAQQLPNPSKTAAVWREEAQKAGIGDILLASVESKYAQPEDPTSFGFDVAVEFQPDWGNEGAPLRKGTNWQRLRRLGLSSRAYEENLIFHYPSVVENMLRRKAPPYKRLPCVMPSWDNSARRKTGATIFKDASPEVYQQWLQTVIEQSAPVYDDSKIVFINAWNEWAEGNHLEPCQRWGRAYLEATRQAVIDAQRSQLEQASPLTVTNPAAVEGAPTYSFRKP